MQTIKQTIEDFRGIRTLFIPDTRTIQTKLMVNVSDGEIVKYTGIYYKPGANMNDMPQELEATFIGKVECQRYRCDLGITGIYIIPLYVYLSSSFFDDKNPENVRTPELETSVGVQGLSGDNSLSKDNIKWHKITNYRSPTNKYFYYPHLLMLPQHDYHYKPLYFTHTIENISLEDFLRTQVNDIGNIELHYV